jgi:nucleotide-binding universal stress UspA family protein
VKILLAVDGSKYSRRAVDYLIRHRIAFGEKPDVHLVHVQPRLPARAAAALSRAAVERYYGEQAEKALGQTGRVLAARRIAFKEVRLLGDPGETLAAYARNGRFSLIVMGSRGLGGLSSLVLGSVAYKVLANCKVPALIVR